MNGLHQTEQLARLYGDRGDARDVEAAALAAALPELGECIAAQLAELSRDPSRERCERVVANLSGVIAHIRRLDALQGVAR